MSIGPRFETYGMRSEEFRKNPCLEQACSEYASHALTTYKMGHLKSLYILGVYDQWIVPLIDEELSTIRRNGADTKTNFIYSADVHEADKINGHRIHVSVDIDVIKNLNCVSKPEWSGQTGPSVEDLSDVIESLISRNRLVAFDIVGYQPDDLNREPVPKNTEGLEIYRKLLPKL